MMQDISYYVNLPPAMLQTAWEKGSHLSQYLDSLTGFPPVWLRVTALLRLMTQEERKNQGGQIIGKAARMNNPPQLRERTCPPLVQ